MDTGVLEQIWSVLPEGYVFLPRIKGWKTRGSGKLEAENYREGKAYTPKDAIAAISRWDTSGIDVYFTPLTYSQPDRKKEYVNPSRVLFADLDDCDPRALPEELRPTTYWKSSEKHFQGLWLLDRTLPPEEFEELNRAISYAVGADKSGWDLTQILRIPGSENYKKGEPDPCVLLKHSATPVEVDRMKRALSAIPRKAEASDTEWPLPKRAIDLLAATEFPVGERSERLWELEKLMIESGMPVAEMFRLLKTSGWNKFAERRDGDTALLKDIMKAEAEYRVSRITTSVAIPSASDALTDFYSLVTGNAEKPSFMVDGFLVDGSVGAAAGEPKTMKSTVVLDLAVAVASGKPFLGRYKVNRSCPVLYIQEENSAADITFRLQRIALHHGVATQTSVGVMVADIPLFIMNNKGLNLTEKTDRESLERLVKENNIGLLVLDPWYMMVAGIDEDKSKDVSPVLKYLTYLRNVYNCTVLLVHHFKKGDTTRPGQRMRGSSVFHAWVETGLYFRVKKGKPGDIIVDREFRSVSTNTAVNLHFLQSEDEYDVTADEDTSVIASTLTPIKTVSLPSAEAEEELDEEIAMPSAAEITGAPVDWIGCARAGKSLKDTMIITGLSRASLLQAVNAAVRRGTVSGVLKDSDTDFSGLRW